MPYGYIDPVQRVREQQALRRMGQPWQQPAAWQPAGPADYQPPAGPHLGQWNAPPRQQNSEPNVAGRLAVFAIGAVIGYLVYRNWHRAWVRAVSTAFWSLPLAWLLVYMGFSLIQHFVAPNSVDGYPVGFGTFAAGAAISAAVSVIAVRKWGRR